MPSVPFERCATPLERRLWLELAALEARAGEQARASAVPTVLDPDSDARRKSATRGRSSARAERRSGHRLVAAARAQCYRRALSAVARNRAIEKAKSLGAVPDDFSVEDVYAHWASRGGGASGRAIVNPVTGRFVALTEERIPNEHTAGYEVWFMARLARLQGDCDSVLRELGRTWEALVDGGFVNTPAGLEYFPDPNVHQRRGTLVYPSGSGNTARDSNGRWSYPNGLRAATSDEFKLPSSRRLFQQGRWYDKGGGARELRSLLLHEVRGCVPKAKYGPAVEGVRRVADRPIIQALAVAELLQW